MGETDGVRVEERAPVEADICCASGNKEKVQVGRSREKQKTLEQVLCGGQEEEGKSEKELRAGRM